MVKPIDQGLIPFNAGEFRTNMDKLVFLPMNHPPAVVDLVTIYRPPAEHPAIIREHVIPLSAKSIWLQRPIESLETRKIANELGLGYVQGHDIREIIC